MLRDPEGVERRTIHDLLAPSGGKVLEIGCGDGRLTTEILTCAESVVGLEPDPESLAKARQVKNTNLQFILGSGMEIPLHSAIFDAVVFSLSLHHHPDPSHALLEAGRVLSDKGRLLVLEPAADSPVNRLFRIIHDENDAYDKVIKAIGTCGMQVADEGTYGSVWRFDGFDEMIKHMFSYFDMEPDPVSTDRMAALLGDGLKLRPLKIEDVTRYWVLKSWPGCSQPARS